MKLVTIRNNEIDEVINQYKTRDNIANTMLGVATRLQKMIECDFYCKWGENWVVVYNSDNQVIITVDVEELS